MAKKKKKEKSKDTLYGVIKPFIQHKQVLYAVLGAVGAGAAMGFMLGPEKAHNLIHNFTNTIKNFGQYKPPKPKKKKLPKLGKRKKQPKSFELEDI